MREDEKRLITYCGLYCGDCPYGSGEVVRNVENLLETLDRWSFSRVAPGLASMLERYKALADYDTFIDVMHSMLQLTCHAPCRNRGGLETCRIRDCCVGKGFDGCWQCGEFETCGTLSWLEPAHGSSLIENLRLIRDRGEKEFIEGERHW